METEIFWRLEWANILSNSKKYPDGFADILANPSEAPDNVENSVDFIKRVKSVIDEVVEQNIGNRIIIVTHPDIIQAAICAALDISCR